MIFECSSTITSSSKTKEDDQKQCSSSSSTASSSLSTTPAENKQQSLTKYMNKVSQSKSLALTNALGEWILKDCRWKTKGWPKFLQLLQGMNSTHHQ